MTIAASPNSGPSRGSGSPIAPYPLVCRPILVPKPWGGRTLERVFGRELPAGVAIGESWEVSPLSAAMSVVENGPLAGWPLDVALRAMSPAPSPPIASARETRFAFPWLIKILDARENLSVQVHPTPRPPGQPQSPDLKHEAWYILDAEPGALIYAGLREGVSRDALVRAAGTREIVDLLNAIPVAAGDCVYLPSGTIHALGAGILVAEVQTPSDTTYRLYDWERVDAGGTRRAMHIAEGLANTRFDLTLSDLRPRPDRPSGAWSGRGEPQVRCPAFQLDRVSFGVPTDHTAIAGGGEAVLVINGTVTVSGDAFAAQLLRAGTTVVLPPGLSRTCWQPGPLPLTVLSITP